MPRPRKLKAAKEELKEVHLPLDQIQPPTGPARINISPDAVVELAQTIKENGQLQAITVNRREDHYEIIYGHRRYLACRHLKMQTIRGCVVDWTEDKIVSARLIENLAREQMTSVEIAMQLFKLKDEHGYTQKQLALTVGKSQAYVSDHLKIMSYPESLRDALSYKRITFSVARELARLTDESYLNHYLHQSANHGATPAVVKNWVDDALIHEQHKGTIEDLPEPSHDAPEPRVDGKDCMVCDKLKPYSVLNSVWMCNGCLKALNNELHNIEEKQETTGG